MKYMATKQGSLVFRPKLLDEVSSHRARGACD